MPRAALLRHDLPDGSSHFDWMIQRRGGDDAPLVTFRVGVRIDLAPPRFDAERIGDHRAAYLDLEGEVSGGRGRVTRVAEGELEIVADEPDRFIARGALGGARGSFTGTRGAQDRWGFAFTPPT